MMDITEVRVVLGAILFLLIVMIIMLMVVMHRLKKMGLKIHSITSDVYNIRFGRHGLNDVYSNIGRLNARYGDVLVALDKLKKTLEKKEEPEEDEIPIHLITKEEYEKKNSGFGKVKMEYDSKRDSLYLLVGPAGILFIEKEVREGRIGDALKYFGVCSKCDKTVYVRNHELNVDYRITKV